MPRKQKHCPICTFLVPIEALQCSMCRTELLDGIKAADAQGNKWASDFPSTTDKVSTFVPPKELTESLKPRGFLSKASLKKSSGSKDGPSGSAKSPLPSGDSKTDNRLPLMPKSQPPSSPTANEKRTNQLASNAGKKRKLPPCPNLPRMKRRVVNEAEKKSGEPPGEVTKSNISLKRVDLEGSDKTTSLEVSPPPRMNWDSETLALTDPSVKADQMADVREAKPVLSSPKLLKCCSLPHLNDVSAKDPRDEDKISSGERSSKENNTPPPSDDDYLDDQPLGNQVLSNKPPLAKNKSFNLSTHETPAQGRDVVTTNAHHPFESLNLDELHEKSDEEDNSNIWSCEVCTFHNPLDASYCEICGCEAGSSVESQKQPLSMAGKSGITPGGPSPDPPSSAQVKPKNKRNSKFLSKLICPPTSRHKTKCSAQLPVPFKSPLSIPVTKIFYDKRENVPRPVRQTQNRRSIQESKRTAKEFELQWELNKVKQKYKSLFEKLGSVVKCKKAAEKDYNRNFGYAEDVRKACNELELQLKVKQKQLQKKLEIVKMSKEFLDESELKVRESNREVDVVQQKMNDLQMRIQDLRTMPLQPVVPQRAPTSILSGSVDCATGKAKVKTVSFDLGEEKCSTKAEPPKYSTPNSLFPTRPRKSVKLKRSKNGLRSFFKRAPPGPPSIPPPNSNLPSGKAIGRPASSKADWLYPKRKKRKKKRQLTQTSRMKMEKIRNGAGKTLFKILTVYDLAQRIEESIFNMCNYDVGTYSKRARDIIFNLKRNKELKERMLSGSLPPEILVSMTNDELASKKLKDKRSQVKKYNMTAHLLNPYETEANTSEYKCEKCGSRKCIFKMVQMDRGDEPLEVFVTCISCQNHWKVDQ